MEFNEALSIIREKYPHNRVISCFEYKDLFVFLITGLTMLAVTPSGFYVSVDRNTKECRSFDYMKKLWSDEGPEMAEAAGSTVRCVDFTEEEVDSVVRKGH